MKAELTASYFAKNHPSVNFYCPQLKSSPTGAIKQLEQIVNQHPKQTWLIIGSSLGGYFATYLSEKFSARAVLINPAVAPYNALEELVGEQQNPYTGEVYQIIPEHMDDLKALDFTYITKKNYLVMVQTGDEVLDYRHAVEKYQSCQVIVQDGGDHSFINFENMLPKIALFFNL